MPRAANSSRHYRARFTSLAIVIGGHLALFALFTESGKRAVDTSQDERMSLVFIDLPDENAEDPPVARAALPRSRPSHAPASIPEDTSAAASAVITQPGIDWDMAARRAAAREATAPELRDFGFPQREPAPREKQDFGWDKTHTERVSPLPGGGTLIRLSDNCSIVLAPLPLGGCRLGKRKARGDLFDEMDSPPELGDWKH